MGFLSFLNPFKIIEKIGDFIAGGVEEIGQAIGENIIEPIGEAITDVIEPVADAAVDLIDNAMNTVESVMGNPELFMTLGLNIMAPGIGSAIGGALGASGAAASVLGNSLMRGVLSEATGGDFTKAAFTSAITGGMGQYAGDVGAAFGIEDAATAKAVGSAVLKTGYAAATGGNVSDALLEGTIVSAISLANAPKFDATEREGTLAKSTMTDVDTTPDNIDVGGGWSPAGIEPVALPPVFDATEREGTLAKPTPATTPDIGFKDVAKALIGAGSAGATAAVTKSVVKKQAPMIDVQYKELKGKELYKDAPLAGYQMVKMTNDQGAVKYIPFINNRPQLKVPAGFKPAEMAQGGFVKRRV